MTSSEFERWLSKQGVTIVVDRGKGGHVLLEYQGKTQTLPRHGSGHELGKGLVNRIKKELGLK